MVDRFAERLRDTERWLQPKSQALDEAAMRMDRALSVILETKRLQCEKALLHLKSIEPQRLISALQEKLARWVERLESANVHGIEQVGNRLRFAVQKLETLSPRRVLERGFAVVQSRKGIVTSSEGLEQGEALAVLLARGGIKVKVEKVCENWGNIKE